MPDLCVVMLFPCPLSRALVPVNVVHTVPILDTTRRYCLPILVKSQQAPIELPSCILDGIECLFIGASERHHSNIVTSDKSALHDFMNE